MDDLKPLKHLNKKKSGIVKLSLLLLLVAVSAVLVFWWQSEPTSSVISYVLSRGKSLRADNGRVNVLLLGIAGGNHEGPNLTDTIIVASYDLKSDTVDLISLPRDLWISEHQAKVNSLYQIGLNKGDGLGWVKEEIGKILGLNIRYAIRVDFNGFIKAIDLVEGLDIEVVRSFEDSLYPIDGKQNDACQYSESQVDIDEEKAKELGVKNGRLKALLDPLGKIVVIAAEEGKDIVYSDEEVGKFFHCRFERLKFSKGMTNMDGELALKFIRSRHGNNGEGSDFARSKRQQQVMQAFKDKVLSFKILLDPGRILDLLKTFGDSVESDIPSSDYVDFIKLIKKLQGSRSVALSTEGDDPLLVSPRQEDYGGAWVLIPAGNDFIRIHQYIEDILSGSGKLEATASAQPN